MNPKAQKRMQKYNEQDVRLLGPLYDRLLPWVPSHPSYGAFRGEDDTCPGCGSTALVKEGFAFTATSRYQRLRCASCGRWSRSTKREAKTNVTQLAG